MPSTAPTPLARALGRVPTGLYVVTSLLDGQPVGFIGSFLIQVGLQPPVVCVAIGKGRDHLEAIRKHGHFAVSILDPESKGVMGTFFKPRPDGSSPFDDIPHHAAPSGAPVLDGALAWFECRMSSEHATGDHVVVFGEVEAGEQQREGDPSVHLRKDGLGY